MLYCIYKVKYYGGGRMFRSMRRHDKGMIDNEALELLKNGDYGVLSMVGDEEYPYGVPLNYAYKEGQIYFHSALEGHKLDGIKRNNKVSFCVVGEIEILPNEFSTKYESVIVFGRVEEVKGENEKRSGLLEIIKKYSSDYVDKGIKYIDSDYKKTALFRITIEHMTGKKANE